MKAVLAALGGTGTLAAALFMPTVVLTLTLAVVGVLGIVAGVVFHSSDEPAGRMERLINAVRRTEPKPVDQLPADPKESVQQASPAIMIEAGGDDTSGMRKRAAKKSAAPHQPG